VLPVQRAQVRGGEVDAVTARRFINLTIATPIAVLFVVAGATHHWWLAAYLFAAFLFYRRLGETLSKD
jgi:hypothetical protein